MPRRSFMSPERARIASSDDASERRAAAAWARVSYTWVRTGSAWLSRQFRNTLQELRRGTLRRGRPERPSQLRVGVLADPLELIFNKVELVAAPDRVPQAV